MNRHSFCPQIGTVWWEVIPSKQAVSDGDAAEELILGADKWF